MHCATCPNRASGSCGSDGPITARLLIVGMAPGANELVAGKPFIGASGRLLNAALASAAIPRSSVRVINVINCAPAGKGDKITPQQFQACAERFEADVSASGAEVVLALGADALLRLTGQKGQITRWRGHLLRPDDLTPIRAVKGAIEPALPPGCRWVVPSLHPSFVIRNGLKPLPFLFEDVKRVARALNDELKIVGVGKQLDYSSLNGEALTIDIETDEAGVNRLGLATADASGSWDFARGRFDSLLASSSLKIGHNISFDILHLRKEGVRVEGPLWDTMWAGQMLQPDLDKNLDTMSSLYLDIPRWKHLNRSAPEYYNQMDVVATQALYDVQRPELEATGQLHLFEREMKCLPILIDMTEAGVRIDPIARARLQAGLDARYAAAKDRWATLAPAVNPASPAQLRKLLYFDLGLPAAHKKGQVDPTTDRAALQKLKKKATGRAGEVVKVLLEIREVSKLLSVYFNNDDRIYPSYFPVGKDDDRYGTATGRLSCQNPNIQQVPKALRSMYVPEPGHVMVVADWSQLELRIAAYLASDAKLIDLFESGRDPFAEIARSFKGVDRTRIKNLVYGGGCYGAGWKKLGLTLEAQGLDVPAKTIKEFLAWFAREFPGLAYRNAQVVRDARRSGYVENAFGRKRYFYDADEHTPEIINFPIQSAAADILWKKLPALNDLSHRMGGRPPIALIHDEIILQALPSQAHATAHALQFIMEDWVPEVAPGFRVPAKVSIGPSWGELKELS